METMAETEGSHWLDESIIEYEIQVCLNYPVFEAEIRSLLIENEMDIQIPGIRYDELGVYYFCPSVESQALKRIEVREGLEKALERLKGRVEHLNNVLCELDNLYQDVIRMFYVEMKSEAEIAELMGFRNAQQVKRVRKDALLDVLYIYRQERKQRAIKRDAPLEELKMRKIQALKEMLAAQRRKSIESEGETVEQTNR